MTDTAFAPRPRPTGSAPLGDPADPDRPYPDRPDPDRPDPDRPNLDRPDPDRPGPGAPPPPGGGEGGPPPTVPPAGTGRPGPDGRARRRWAVGALALLLAVGGGAGGGALAGRLDDPPAATTAATATLVRAAAGTDGLTAVAAAVSPSVVTVFVDGVDSAEGSGVVVGADGLVVTNNHVVSAGGTVSVRLADGRTAPADVVGADRGADLAVLRVRGPSGLTPVAYGSSDALRVGDTVLAFGSPLGLTGTVTAGIVSAVGRDVDLGDGNRLTDAVQTDAAINAGNSGGALVDTAGRLVGVNVAIATTGEGAGNIGVGFAIPADTVRTVVDRLVGASS